MLLKRSLGVFLLLAALPATARADATARACIESHESAIRLRRERHLRDAREELLRCAAATCPSEVQLECAKSLGEVSAEIPTLVVSVQGEGGRDEVSLTVSIDGTRVLTHLDGTAIPLDPGQHDVEVDAPGHAPVHRMVLMHEGEKDRRETIVLASNVVKERDPTRRRIGLVTSGVGLASVAFGFVAGAIASAAWSQSQSECNTSACSSPAQALGHHDTAQLWANASTATLVSGAALVAIGGIVFFTAPWMSPNRSAAGLSLGGRF